MRLRKAGTWLLMGASSVKGQVFDQPKDSVIFRSFIGEVDLSAAVFIANGEKTFFFDFAPGIQVTSVKLRKGLVVDDNTDGETVADGTPEGSSDSSSLILTTTSRKIPGPSNIPPTKRETRQIETALRQGQSDAASNAADNPANLKITPLLGSAGQVTAQQIDISQADVVKITNDTRNDIVFFDVTWDQGSGRNGRSFSRYLAFTFDTASAASLVKDPHLRSQDPAEEERQPQSDPNTAGNGDGGGSNSSDGDASTTSTSTATSSPSSGIPLGGVSASGSGNPLSTGAIAGIAVGSAVVGLLIIGALAFFLLRRRKRRSLDHDGAVGYGNGRPPHRRTADLMAEKEATAGVGETPHSPYSEDGGMHGAAAAAGTEPLRSEVERERDRDREFSPYTDAAPGASSSRAVDAPSVADGEASMSGAGVGAAPARSGAASQMSGRYAHLIEEGMTHEEIARLEEEERQLDAAIERAGASGH